MIDKLSALRQRYQAALHRLAGEAQLPEPAVAKMLGNLDRASRHVLNLRGVFAGRRINQVLDEIAESAGVSCLVPPDPFQDGWEWFIPC